MGKLNIGILGGFNGKVGTVVGYTWKGKCLMRAYVANPNNPNTIKQREQRGKFALAIKFLRTWTGYQAATFKEAADALKQTPQNVALSHCLSDAVKGEYPGYEIDYDRLKTGVGSLDAADFVIAKADGKIGLTWKNGENIAGDKSDHVAILLCNADEGKATYALNAGTRGDGTASIDIPETWGEGDEVYVYGAFVAEDGKRNSDGVLGGKVTI